MSDKATLACTYASLILYDDDLEVNGENITKLLKSAGITVEKYWPGLFADLIQNRPVPELIADACKGGGGGGGAAAQAADAGAGAADAAPAEEPEEESEEEESAAAAPGLFGDDSSSEESSSD